MKSYKHLFSRSITAAPNRLHFAAHSHHLWPDASFEGHLEAWNDAALLADLKWDKVFDDVIPTAQGHIASELNLPDPNTITFAPNTHELVLRIVSAKETNEPLNLLMSDGEFHSFRRQSARWEERGAVRRRIVACEPFNTFTQRYLEAIGERAPDIAFVSHVMFQTGLRFEDLEALARFARPDGMWVIVDGYHAFMAIPTDLQSVAERIFYIGGGYKYAMAGEGAGFLHAPPNFGPRPADTGWYAEFAKLESKTTGVPYPAHAQRFMGATFDPSALYRFNAVRKMLEAEGLDTKSIHARVEALRDKLAAAIASGKSGVLREAVVLRPNASGPRSRYVALRHPMATAWKARLVEHDVITDARGDVLRIGLGLYHDEEDIDLLCERVVRAL